MHFAVNDHAHFAFFLTVTTAAVIGTYTQCPPQLCEEVAIYVPGAASVNIGGSSSPGNAIINAPAGQVTLVKTGGQLSNLWIAPTTAAAVNIGLQAIQYKPIT